MGGVEISKSGVQILVHHLGGLWNVNLFPVHRQAHKAKAKVAVKSFHPHMSFPRKANQAPPGHPAERCIYGPIITEKEGKGKPGERLSFQ